MPTAAAFLLALVGIALAAAAGTWLSGPVDRWFDRMAARRIARRHMQRERGASPKTNAAL